LIQPRVVETTFGIDRKNTLTVRFDKAVDAGDRKHFTVKKGDDVIPVKEVVPADETNKVFYVNFYKEPLDYGTYNLKISGVQDKTALKNTMVEYNGTFVASDVANPKVKQADYNNSNRKVALNFMRDMDVNSLNTKANYYIKFAKNPADEGTYISLPVEVAVNSVNSGKSVVLQFPEFINGARVSFGENGTVKEIHATGLKSRTGQAVSMNEIKLADAASSLVAESAVQKDATTFEVTFNTAVANANIGDFRVNGTYPSEVKYEDNKVTIKTNNEYFNNSTVTVYSSSLETYSGLKMAADKELNTSNAISPKVSWNTSTDLQQVNRTVYIPFTASLATQYEGQTLAPQAAHDLLIKNIATNKDLNATIDYTTDIVDYNGVTNGAVKVTFVKAYDNPLTVQVRDGAKFIRSFADVTKTAVKSDVYTISKNTEAAENVTATASVYKVPVQGVKAFATVAGLKLEAKEAGVKGNITVAVEPLTVAGTDVTVEAGKITYQKDATVQHIVDAVAAKDVNYVASKVGDALPTTEFKLAGGVDAVNGEVTVKLNKAITSVTELTINGTLYTGTLSADKSSIAVDTKGANVAGLKLNLKVKDANGKDVTVPEVVIAAK